MDDNLGPVAVSLRREKVADGGTSSSVKSDAGAGWLYQYRLIVRTSEVTTLFASLVSVMWAMIKFLLFPRYSLGCFRELVAVHFEH